MTQSGNLHRNGSVYCTQAIEVSDHDYPYLADVKIAPHGIYDMKKNKAYINLGVSFETAEFVCDALKNWWQNHGKSEYPKAKEILIFCDSGGANSYRHNIFKIEHRVFPDITKALDGVPLNTVDEAKNKISSVKKNRIVGSD